MQKLQALVFVFVMTLGSLAWGAPPKHDGRWARPNVLKYHKKQGWTTNVRVHKVRFSSSGKSSQVAVANRFGGKVRLYNVHRSTGRISKTKTGLTSQNQASLRSNRKMRRVRKPLRGTFAGIRKQGLSRSGKSYKFRSQTSRQRTYVPLQGGQLRKMSRGLAPPPKIFR